MPDEFLPDEIDVNFEKTSLHKLYSTGFNGEINPERWERVRTEIRFEDVVSEVAGISGSTSIRCPFHGRDSTPSFFLYKGTNDGWCFGCPPKEQYYDQVRFVSRYLDISRVAALRWLERKWELPAIADLEGDVEDVVEGHTVLSFEDLQEPYIRKAIRQVQEFKDVELAEDYLTHYFKSIQNMKFADDAKKEGEGEDATAYEEKASRILARALGREELGHIFARKQARN
jgi:hypothetical protein